MHVQHVDGEVVGGEVHGLEDLPQRHGVAGLVSAHARVRLRLQGLLDEAQQVLLVHARSRVDMGVHL